MSASRSSRQVPTPACRIVDVAGYQRSACGGCFAGTPLHRHTTRLRVALQLTGRWLAGTLAIQCWTIFVLLRRRQLRSVSNDQHRRPAQNAGGWLAATARVRPRAARQGFQTGVVAASGAHLLYDVRSASWPNLGFESLVTGTCSAARQYVCACSRGGWKGWHGHVTCRAGTGSSVGAVSLGPAGYGGASGCWPVCATGVGTCGGAAVHDSSRRRRG